MSIKDMRAKGIRVTGNSTYKKEKIKIIGDSVTISNKPIGDIPFIYIFDDKEIDKIIAIEQDFKVKNRTIFFNSDIFDGKIASISYLSREVICCN